MSPEYSLEGLMLKLKLQYFGHLMQRTDSLEKTLMLGRIEGGRRRGCLFTLLRVCFDVQKLLRLIRSHLFIFVFISNILGGGS